MGVKINDLTNLTSYQVSEEASPIDPSSFSGGVGQLTFDIDSRVFTPRMLDKGVTLEDGARGKFAAKISDIAPSESGLSNVTATSALGAMNSWRRVLPYNGTLGGYVRYLLNAVGYTDASLHVDPSIDARAVVCPGFLGNVWDFTKQFLAVQQVEIALVFNRVVVRPFRTVVASESRRFTHNLKYTKPETAEAVEVAWYNHRWGTQVEFYPGDGDSSSSITVESGEEVTQVFEVSGSVQSLNQPVVQDFVFNRSYAGTNGVYSITGSDNLPVPAAQWRARGGRLEVQPGDSPNQIKVFVRGAEIDDLAPFQISMSAGSGSNYNSLHITGTGVVSLRDTLLFRTGEAVGSSGSEVGTTVDNPFISSRGQAITAALYAAKNFNGPIVTLDGSAYSLNDTGVDDEFVAASIGDFNITNSTTTIAQFNAEYAGNSINSFNTIWQNYINNRFEAQFFGQGIGARIVEDNAIYRIVSTTTTPTRVDYSATMDSTVGDFNASNSGKTIAQFNARHTGYRILDFNMSPLEV